MKTAEFSEPIRQSVKGIVIIFGWQVYQFVRRFFILFFAIIYSRFNDGSIGGIPLFYIVLSIILVVIGFLVFAILKYLNFKFYLTQDDFFLNSGIITKEETRIAKRKIQNVYIKQNFLQQLINVVSLTIETAGDNKSEIEINALDRPQAVRLKSELFSSESVIQDSDSKISSEDHSKVYFRASFKRLLLEGISQNHLRSLLIIAAFFFGLFEEFKGIFNNYDLQQRLSEYLNFESETLQTIILFNLIALSFALFVSIVFSIVKTFVVNFNLEVIETGNTFEINKGLFNKITLSLTPSRVQNISISTNRFKRYLGLYRFSVKQAMVNKKLQGNFKIVAIDKQQTDYLLQSLFKAYNSNLQKHKPDNYFKRVMLFRAAILLTVISIFMYLLVGLSALLMHIVLIPYALVYVWTKYRKAYFMIDDTYLTVGRGFFDTSTQIMELHKIQSLRFKQSIFQKRNGVASVEVSTASKTLYVVHINEKIAKSLGNFMLYKVESQPRDWM